MSNDCSECMPRVAKKIERKFNIFKQNLAYMQTIQQTIKVLIPQ